MNSVISSVPEYCWDYTISLSSRKTCLLETAPGSVVEELRPAAREGKTVA